MLKLPSWLAAPDTPTETNINIIRALAVSSVFLHHAYAYLGVKTPIFGMAGGLIGVLLFFLISGYLIGKSAEKHALPDLHNAHAQWWDLSWASSHNMGPCDIYTT